LLVWVPVEARAVVVDLNGQEIRGSGVGAGVRILNGGVEGAEIVGGVGAIPGVISGFREGIRSTRPDDLRLLTNVVVRDSREDGVVVRGNRASKSVRVEERRRRPARERQIDRLVGVDADGNGGRGMHDRARAGERKSHRRTIVSAVRAAGVESMMRRASRSFVLLAVGLATISSHDACARSSPPARTTSAARRRSCNITQRLMSFGSVLDFGTRTVNVWGDGVIDVGSGTARIRAGRFTVQVSGTGIRLNEGTRGGLLRLESYRKCSLNPAVRCLADVTCDVAGAGACSAGSGEVDLQGRSLGSAEYPGGLIVRAGGDVRIGQRIQISGDTKLSDGGTVDIDAGGSFFIDGSIEVNSGGEGTGGDISLRAGVDLL
jgi:hypothetical protein